MNEPFTLTVNYKREDRDYNAHLLMQGYSYKIVVQVDEMDVYFERDDSGDFRVVAMPGQDIAKLEKINKELLQLLAVELSNILK